jgi:hypothetical protein
MASQVLSGATNATYTNNTGQNVRLIINYMSRVTSMTWAGVNVTASATTIGKDIQNITGELRQAVTGTKVVDFIGPNAGPSPNEPLGSLFNAEIAGAKAYLLRAGTPDPIDANPEVYMPSGLLGGTSAPFSSSIANVMLAPPPSNTFYQDVGNGTGEFAEFSPNLFYVPLTISRGGNFPVELMLASGQAFSAVCGAFNAIVIREDGT